MQALSVQCFTVTKNHLIVSKHDQNCTSFVVSILFRKTGGTYSKGVLTVYLRAVVSLRIHGILLPSSYIVAVILPQVGDDKVIKQWNVAQSFDTNFETSQALINTIIGKVPYCKANTDFLLLMFICSYDIPTLGNI